MLPLRKQLERAPTSELFSRRNARIFRAWMLEEAVRGNSRVSVDSGQTDEFSLPRGYALDGDENEDEEYGKNCESFSSACLGGY